MPVPEFFCHASCDHHDFRYWVGGDEAARELADHEFLVAMLVDAGDDPTKQTIAFTYWMAVRMFGSMFFNYTEHPRDEIDLKFAMEGHSSALRPSPPAWGFNYTWLKPVES